MQILSVTPNVMEQGQTNTLAIKGEDFVNDAAVSFSGTGIDVETQFVDGDTLTVIATVAANATVGLRDVTVTLPDATTATLASVVGVTNFQSLTNQMRLLIGERIRPSESENDTEFLNEELIDMILRHGGNLYLAAAEAWSAKAADYSKLVDISESGSDRKLSQMFKQANIMAASYAEAGEQIGQELIMPVVGQSVAWLRPSSTLDTNLADDPFTDPFRFLSSQAFRFVSRPWYPITVFDPSNP
jgi:hypothetical protein